MAPEERIAIEDLLRRGALTREALSVAQREHAARAQQGQPVSLLELIRSRYLAAGSSETLRSPGSARPATRPDEESGSHFGGSRVSADSGRITQAASVSQTQAGSSARLQLRVGPYRVEDELARGGMGVVYRAHHEQLGRRVALKLLQGGASASQRQRERFRLEAEAAARLRHPHVVAVHDVGEAEDGTPYLAMDLVEGESLDERIEREGAQPAALAAQLVEKVARAVDYAHEHLILHRDLKPANVLVDQATGEPLLTDFGLAKLVDDERERITRTGQMMGTPHYAAPEQLGGKPVDQRADVYGLGGTLYALLVGEPPFSGETLIELANQVAHEEPLPPSTRVKGIDKDLETICLRCLEKEPGLRYQSARALADDLSRYLANETIEARRPTFLERGKKWTRRHRALTVALSGVASALLLAAIGGVAVVTRQREAARQQAQRAAGQEAARAWEELQACSDAQERTPRALVALQAAQRWHTLEPNEASARARRRAALALGDEALSSEQWNLARYAFRQGEGLGHEAEIAARLERVEEARAAEGVGRRRRVEGWLKRIAAGETKEWLGGQSDAVFGIVAERGPETTEVLTRTLDEVSEELFVAESEFLRGAAGQVQGLESFLAWRRQGGEPSEEVRALNFQVARSLGDTTGSLRSAAFKESIGQIARSQLASAQRGRLGMERLAQARVCVEALGRLGRDERSHASLARYLRAELDDVRAYHAAMAFLRWGDEASLNEVYSARKRFGLTSTLSSMLGKHLRRFSAPAASGQERTVREVFDLGVRQLAHKDYALAEATFSRVIEIAPNEVGAWTNRGLCRRRLERPAEALADYEQALRIAPKDPEILARRGMAFFRVGNMKAALRDLDEAIDLQPTLEEALFNRALVFRNLRRLDEALLDLEKLVELSPRSPGYLKQLSDIYLGLGRNKEAVATLDRMIELDPHDSNQRAMRAYMLLDSGQHGEAIRELDRTLRQDPNCGFAWSIRGEIAHRRGELSDASDCFRQGSRLSPTHRTARFLAANFYYGQKDYPSALKEATYLVNREPHEPTYLSLRGQILFRLRRLEEAFADWSLALQVLPRCKEALFYRGLAYEQTGRLAQAVRDYRQYLRFWSGTSAARRIRSRLAIVQAQQPGGGQ